MTVKFIYPVSIFRPWGFINEYMDVDTDFCDSVNPTDASVYLDEFSKVHDEEITRRLGSSGIMGSFWYGNISTEKSIKTNVVSAFPSLEVINGRLYGVIKADIKEPLTDSEMEILKSYFRFHMPYEYNNALEHRLVPTLDGDMFLSFQTNSGYFIEIEQEFYKRYRDEQLGEKLDYQDTGYSMRLSASSQEKRVYTSEKLYYPIVASLYLYDNSKNYGSYIFACTDEISKTDAEKYMPYVLTGIEFDNNYVYGERGLVNLFRIENKDLGQAIKNKVFSAVPTVEVVNEKIYGVMDLRLYEQLTPEEWTSLKNCVTQVIAHGNGLTSGFMEHNIPVFDGELRISYSSLEIDYFIATQQEFEQRLAMGAWQEFNDGSMQAPSM